MVPVAAPLDQNQRIASVSPSASLIFPVLPPAFNKKIINLYCKNKPTNCISKTVMKSYGIFCFKHVKISGNSDDAKKPKK
jgi:hypothetical protein